MDEDQVVPDLPIQPAESIQYPNQPREINELQPSCSDVELPMPDDDQRYDAEDEEEEEEEDSEESTPQWQLNSNFYSTFKMNPADPSMPRKLFRDDKSHKQEHYHYQSSSEEGDIAVAFPSYEFVAQSEEEDGFAYAYDLKLSDSDSGYSENTLLR